MYHPSFNFSFLLYILYFVSFYFYSVFNSDSERFGSITYSDYLRQLVWAFCFFYLLIWHYLSACGVLLMLFFNEAQPRLSRLVAATKTASPHCYQCDDVCFSFEWLKSLLLLSFYRPFLPALLLLRNCGSGRRSVFMLL